MSDLILNLADCGLNELICGFSRGLSHKSGFVILSLSKDEPVEGWACRRPVQHCRSLAIQTINLSL